MFSKIYVRKDVFLDMGAKMKEYSSSQEEVVTEGKTNTQVDEIKNLKLNQLINFKDHPFKVETNTELFELMQSIEKDGVLVPLLARPNPNGEGYELISGDIPVGRIFGKLEVIALIVLKDNINHFVNSDWNDDYNGISFDLAKGSIIGYKNLPALDIVKNYEELTSASSIFTIYKRLTTEEKPMDVNIDSSLIKIGLGTQEYEIYSRFCKKTQFQPILNSMLVFPALVYVFEELKQETGIEANQGKAWYISLDKAYEKRGINFMDEIKDDTKTSVQLAQEAMELPLSKALSMFTELFENMEDEEDV